MFTTLTIESLENVTGGATTEQLAGQQAEQDKYEGCKQWAASSHEGKDFKAGVCTQEFARRNWDNFAPQAGAQRRQPL